MNDGTKIAAATLAVEAAKQKLEMNRPSRPGGYDIAGELLTYYRHFLQEVGSDPQKG
jgi:hypothetical protein